MFPGSKWRRGGGDERVKVNPQLGIGRRFQLELSGTVMDLGQWRQLLNQAGLRRCAFAHRGFREISFRSNRIDERRGSVQEPLSVMGEAVQTWKASGGCKANTVLVDLFRVWGQRDREKGGKKNPMEAVCALTHL